MLAARRLLAPAARAPPLVREFASRKHKKFVKLAKGYRRRTNCFRIAVQRVETAWQYAFRDRKVKKREMRKGWIRAINAGSRAHGVAYNRLICGLRTADIDLNRKVLADLAVSEPRSFVVAEGSRRRLALPSVRRRSRSRRARERWRMIRTFFLLNGYPCLLAVCPCLRGVFTYK